MPTKEEFAFLGSAKRFGELTCTMGVSAERRNAAFDEAIAAMDAIKAKESGWKEFFRNHLSSDTEAIVLLAADALRDEKADRESVVNALRRVAQGTTMVSSMARETLRHRFHIVLAPGR